VRKLDIPWGRPSTPEQVVAVLEEEPDAKAVLLTHNETSTGVLNDLPALSRAIRRVRPKILILVDSISGMLAADLRADEWDLDIVVGGSQKAWMIPPGLTFLSISERAWAAHREAKMPRFYFDITRMKKSMATDQTPYTPALPQLFGLQIALRKILDEGIEASVARHTRMGEATRSAIRALGLQPFAAEGYYSNSLTAIEAPEGLEAKTIRATMREKHGVVIAGGQGAYKDKIFRIGHLGYVDENDVIAAVGALERTLQDLGRPVELGAALGAAQAVFANREA
jgi:aspartate aminotransferase-like enzyme